MRHGARIWLALLAAFAFCATGLVLAQQTTIKEVPIQKTSPASGEEMYEEYCAVCHGKTGKGDGPAVAALKVPPKSLRLLARHNGGKYPAAHVASVLHFGSPIAAHGTSEMPIWGPLFSALHSHELRTRQSFVQMRVTNIVNFIKTLQDE